MVGKCQISLEKHLSSKNLDKLIKEKKIQAKLLKRLKFIEELYNGAHLPKACENIGISTPTGYKWLKLWNEGSYFGLFPKYDYRYEDIFDEYDLENINFKLSKMDKLYLNNVKRLFLNDFGRIFSDDQIKYYLRELGYKYVELEKRYIKNPILNEYDLEKLDIEIFNCPNLTLYDARKILSKNIKIRFSDFQVKSILNEIGYSYDNLYKEFKKKPDLSKDNFKFLEFILSKKTKQLNLDDVREIIYKNFGIFFSNFQIKSILIELGYINRNKSEEPIIISELYKLQLKYFESQLFQRNIFTLDDAKMIMFGITKKIFSDFQMKTILEYLDYSNEYYESDSKEF